MSRCKSCGVNWTDHLGNTGTCKLMQEQAEEIAKLKAKWISVANQLPPIDRRVLFCCTIDGDFFEVDIGQFDGCWTASKNAVAMELDGDDWAPCSHWIELPKPPGPEY